MTKEQERYMRRLEVAEFNIKGTYETFNGDFDDGIYNHVFTNMSRAYLTGIELTKRGLQDVDGYALEMISALARSAAERRPVPEFALIAAKAAITRYAYYLPEPPEPSEAFDSINGINRDTDGTPEGQPYPPPREGRVARAMSDALDPTCLPFNQFMQGPGEPTDGSLHRANGLSAANLSKRPVGPSRDRSGAELFGELMLAYNGNYEMLEGIKFPPQWTEGECQNYMRYKRELEARYAAGRQPIR